MADAPDSLLDLRKDLKRAVKIMDERRDDYVLGRDFYTGDRVEVAASKYVRKVINETADAFPISLAHIPVDVIVDMVELTSMDTKDAGDAKLLATVGEANDIEDGAEDWLRKAAYFGDYYAIIDPTEEDGSGNVRPESVKWIGSSPLTTIVVYDEADERTPLYGVKVWNKGKAWHARIYYDDCTVKLITDDGVSAPDAKQFDLDYDPEVGPEDAFIFHEGGRQLVNHLAIDGHPYGVPLHRKAWGPQDAITKISAGNLANLEGIALPARWALLDPMAEIDDDIDADFGTNGPGTVAGSATDDGRTRAADGGKVRSVPGGISYLRGIKQVGTFESGDGSVFLANQDWYTRAMAVATGIPLFEFDLAGDQPSGESRRRAMARALKKAKRVRRAMGGFLTALAETTLAVLGKSGAIVTATFYPIETSTDQEGIELVGLKIKNGVPVRVALLEAGYTNVQVEEWWPDDAPAVTYDILTQLGTALAQLGTAKTLGVIDDSELAAMLPTILTVARNEGPSTEPDPADAGADAEAIDPATQVVTNPGDILKAKSDALGSLIRSGADPEQAARVVGLDGLSFPNVPVTVRIPEADATGLEGGAPAAPKAPAAPTPPTPPAA